MCLHLWDNHTLRQPQCPLHQVLHQIPSTATPINSYILLNIIMDRCRLDTRPVHIVGVPGYRHIRRVILLRDSRDIFFKRGFYLSIYSLVSLLSSLVFAIQWIRSDMVCGQSHHPHSPSPLPRSLHAADHCPRGLSAFVNSLITDHRDLVTHCLCALSTHNVPFRHFHSLYHIPFHLDSFFSDSVDSGVVLYLFALCFVIPALMPQGCSDLYQ